MQPPSKTRSSSSTGLLPPCLAARRCSLAPLSVRLVRPCAGDEHAAKPVVLLVVSELRASRALDELYRALASSSSRYEPRLVLSPAIRGGCAAVRAHMPSVPKHACRRAAAVYELQGDVDGEDEAWRGEGELTTPGIGGEEGVEAGQAAGGGEGSTTELEGLRLRSEQQHAGVWEAIRSAVEAASTCSSFYVEVDTLMLSARPAVIIMPSATRRPAVCGRQSSAHGAAGGAAAGVDGHTPRSTRLSGDKEAEAAAAEEEEEEEAVGGGGAPHRRQSAPAGGWRAAGSWAGRRASRGGTVEAVGEAFRAAATRHGGTVLIEPSYTEAAMLDWIAPLPLSALRRWAVPRVEIAIITHRRPTSLRRLLTSLECAHYLGDGVDLSFSLEAGADSATIAQTSALAWPHGAKRRFQRVVKGGLIAAVVESWFPSGEHSYGLLLEDDIEVSPFFYLYLKQALLTYVYASRADGGGGGEPPSNLLGISLYTPRLVEIRMPRHRIDLHDFLHAGNGGGGGSLFLQQLPCSWGSLFFPRPWHEFHDYMNQRLHGSAPAVTIPDSATNGWKTSWKKFLIELSYLRGYVVLYPNFHNQSSFSTNHLEPGEHIASKTNKLKHLPIDFTVPLLRDYAKLRTLWAAHPPPRGAHPATGELTLHGLPPLHSLPTLDLFSSITSQEALVAQGAEAVTKQATSLQSGAADVPQRSRFFSWLTELRSH